MLSRFLTEHATNQFQVIDNKRELGGKEKKEVQRGGRMLVFSLGCVVNVLSLV